MPSAANGFHGGPAGAPVRDTDGADGHIEDVPGLVAGGGVCRFRSFPLPVDKVISPGNYLKVHSYFQIRRKVF